ncbi:hypothetical protein BH92_15350 [Rhodococcoides fascians A21d2]|nr:hypothetical protein [Rhodococcus fascians]QII01065.1 hypothetical protein BH92_15350 [Rhodococcus fascians A21d2]
MTIDDDLANLAGKIERNKDRATEIKAVLEELEDRLNQMKEGMDNE